MFDLKIPTNDIGECRYFNGNPLGDASPAAFYGVSIIAGRYADYFMLINAAGQAIWASA